MTDSDSFSLHGSNQPDTLIGELILECLEKHSPKELKDPIIRELMEAEIRVCLKQHKIVSETDRISFTYDECENGHYMDVTIDND